jgi:hypothetical protein
MDTIKLKGYLGVFRGTHYGSVGVYTREFGGVDTYAGTREGVAHGEGVVTQSNGTTVSGQFADGDRHGHSEWHYAGGDVYYVLYERGNIVHSAYVRPDGACRYDDQPCGADHVGFAALKAAAQQAGVCTPPTRIQRKPAPSAEPDARAVSVFALRSVLVPGVGPRLSAYVCKCARVLVCLCVRVPARACICACACVRVRARSCVRGCV